jgi:hypothetical protein
MLPYMMSQVRGVLFLRRPHPNHVGDAWAVSEGRVIQRLRSSPVPTR